MRVHDLKCWPEFFEGLWEGLKTFEVRYNDRNFTVGDTLRLREWDPETRQYTGRWVHRLVTCRYGDTLPGLQTGYCVLGIAEMSPPARDPGGED